MQVVQLGVISWSPLAGAGGFLGGSILIRKEGVGIRARIIGPRTTEQLDGALDSLEIKLDEWSVAS